MLEEEEEEEKEEVEEVEEDEEGHLERLVWPGYEQEIGVALDRILQFAEVRLLSDCGFTFLCFLVIRW